MVLNDERHLLDLIGLRFPVLFWLQIYDVRHVAASKNKMTAGGRFFRKPFTDEHRTKVIERNVRIRRAADDTIFDFIVFSHKSEGVSAN